MPTLRGTIVDRESGAPLEAKVRVIDCQGHVRRPDGAILKVGPGPEAFYCPGEFVVDVFGGPCRITVERGTEYAPLVRDLVLPWKGKQDVTLALERWIDLPQMGWYPGNTHIHYDEKEKNPYDRLKLEPHVNDFSVTVVSILQRWELKYASNRFPLGMFTEYSTAHHVVDVGEESRHNFPDNSFGYGHIMLFRIAEQVEPVSRGMLVNDFDPDYPPLCYACDDARRQGGIVLWCHNGRGMEAPVAAALGKLDGMNLFDPYWMDPEYDLWYRMLNCGIRLPASTGSDWFVCSNNRVYVRAGDAFSYEAWLDGLRRGETFISNGPALLVTVDGVGPGATLDRRPGAKVAVQVSWRSHYPVDRVEIIRDGEVVAAEELPGGSREGQIERGVATDTDGWIAARASGPARDSFDQAVYAHTSPIYVNAGAPPAGRSESARFLAESIGRSLEWVRTKGRFLTKVQRSEVADLFREGQRIYERMAR